MGVVRAVVRLIFPPAYAVCFQQNSEGFFNPYLGSQFARRVVLLCADVPLLRVCSLLSLRLRDREEK